MAIALVDTDELQHMIEEAVQNALTVRDDGLDPGLTIQQVSEITGYGVRTIEDARDRGEIGFEKNGTAVRYRQSEIQAWRDSIYIKRRRKSAA